MDAALNELFGLDGRVAIVTGATKGIGRAIASGLSQAGASVVVSSRDQAACEAVAAEVTAETGRDTLGAALHMGDWDAAPAFVDLVRAHFGRIDVLVNNAGIHPGMATTFDVTQEYFDKLYQVNLRGPVRLAGLAGKVMAEQGKGSIVNVATVGAYHGGPGVGVYTSLKAALVNFTKCMAREMAPLGIRVNAICPGPFDSDMMRGAAAAAPGFMERAGAVTMQNRVADCREIVGAAVYLASDASSFTTGEDHVVSGGQLR